MQIVALLGIVAGVALCFFGYQLFIASLALMGGLVGLAIGATMGVVFGNPLVGIFAALILAAVGGALFPAAYFIPIFATGALAGGLLGYGFSSANPLFGLIGALFGGYFAVQFKKFAIRFSSALCGAALLAFSINFLIAQRGLGGHSNGSVFGLVSFASGALGLLFQLRGAKKNEDRDKLDPESEDDFEAPSAAELVGLPRGTELTGEAVRFVVAEKSKSGLRILLGVILALAGIVLLGVIAGGVGSLFKSDGAQAIATVVIVLAGFGGGFFFLVSKAKPEKQFKPTTRRSSRKREL